MHKISWFEGIEIIQSLFSNHCGIMLAINIKGYLKITQYFQVQCDIYKERFDLAPESFNKVNRLKKTQREFAEKKAIK